MGITVAAVSILRQGSAEGWTKSPLRPCRPVPISKCKIVTILAGRAADMVLGRGADVGAAPISHMPPRNSPQHGRPTALVDGLTVLAPPEQARDLLAIDRPLRSAVERDLARLLDQAVALVESHRLTIRRVAERLIARQVIDADELEAIVAPAVACRSREREKAPSSGARLGGEGL